ncbi:MAG: hypothetical protein ACHQEA_03090 [Gaiellales bacterium]|jgi:hypothetical protein
MGLLTLIRRKRRPCYRVRVHGLGRYSEERFGSLFEAREYADHLASITDVVCLIYLDKGRKPVYCTDDDWGGDEGSSGVREPRRPMPGPSAGAISLELPD